MMRRLFNFGGTVFSMLLVIFVLVWFHKPILYHVETTFIELQCRRLLKEGEKTAATLKYAEGAKKYPQHGPFHLSLGRLYQEKHQLEQAEIHYRQGLERLPEDLDGRLGYGHLLTQQQRYNEALTQYRQARKYHGFSVPLLNQVGQVYQHASGQLPFKYRAFSRWLDLWADYYYRWSLLSEPEQYNTLLNFGVVSQRLNHSETAVLAYCEALLLYPDSAITRYNLGLALTELGVYNTGYQQMTMAIHYLQEHDQVPHAQRLAIQLQQVKNHVNSYRDPQQLKDAAFPERFQASCLSRQPDKKAEEGQTVAAELEMESPPKPPVAHDGH
ncbi:MAG: tetratricopeptide repeat protein [Candidatus Melainabacteria bacterium]|nr:tetratricopeptide repeat protein [Candidatus Melainabacteria bacterium]